MAKKYEFTGEVHFRFPALKRIRALVDIPLHGVKAGDLGGWIESEHNLSHEGDCWVRFPAKVCGYATVMGEAFVSGFAILRDSATARGAARIYGRSVISGRAQVAGNAIVYDTARIADGACIRDFASVSHSGIVRGYAILTDSSHVGGHALVRGYAQIRDTVRIGGHTIVENSLVITGDATINSNKDLDALRLLECKQLATTTILTDDVALAKALAHQYVTSYHG